MKRPLAVFGFTLLMAFFLASVLGTVPSLLLGGVLFLCFLLSFLLKKGETRRYFLLTLFTFSFGLSLFTAHSALVIRPAQTLGGQSAVITAHLTEPVRYNGSKYTYYLKTDAVMLEDAPQSVKVVLTSKERLSLAVNDQVKTEVQFYPNTTASDYGKGYYLRARSLGTVLEHITAPTTLYGKIVQVREQISSAFASLLPGEEGAVLTAMILGDTSALSDAAKRDFSESGVYHLFAVSGLHVSLWGTLAFWLLRKLRLGLKIAGAGSSLFILFYMGLTGFSMSVLRAGIMMIVLLCGRAFLKVPDSVNSLGLSVGVICLLYPSAIYSVSFLLTVGACLGILTLGQNLCAKFRHAFDRFLFGSVMKWILDSVLISFSLMIFTLPVQMLCFQTIVPLSFISNLVFIPLGMVTIVFGGLTALCSAVPLLATPLAFCAGLGAKAMLFLAGAVAEFPLTTVGIGAPYLLLWAAGTLLLFAFGFLLYRHTGFVKLTAFLSAVVLVCSVGSYTFLQRDLLHISVLDVGDGLSVLCSYRGKTLLVGCGGEYGVVSGVSSALQQRNRKQIDLLLLPRLTEKESGGRAELTSSIPVKQVIVPEKNETLSLPVEHFWVGTQITVDFAPSLRVEYRYQENHFAVRITFGSAHILITDSQPNGALRQTGWYEQADLLITSGSLPQGAAAKQVILCSDAYGLEKAAAYRARRVSAVATGEAGDLELYMNQSGAMTIRRENRWPQLAKQN